MDKMQKKNPVSEGETKTVGKPTGKAPDMQNVQDVTETVMEERGWWKRVHQTHRSKSCDTCQWRDMKQQESRANVLEKYVNKWQQNSHL